MNIKTFIAAAVIALTAACTQEPEVEPTEVVTDEAVELNDDGSVKDTETEAVPAE